MKKQMIATVQILVNVDDAADAADALSELFVTSGEIVRDWTYLKLGSQYLIPTEFLIEEPYEEGDFLNG